MAQLENKNIAVLATNGFEDSELSSPVEAAKSEGAQITIVAPSSEDIEGKNGSKVSVDTTTEEARGTDFDGIILPGGTGNADHLRTDEAAVEIVKKHVEAGKPLAVICHGAWTLAEADVLKGRTLTSYPSIRTDLRNAGATVVDEEVVVHGNLVSSRNPDDLPAFCAKIVEHFRA